MKAFFILTLLAIAAPAWALVPPPIPRLSKEDWQQLRGKTEDPAPEPIPGEDPKMDDPAKTIERITQSADAIGERLSKKDTGVETRKKQEQLLKDIDSLLKPPPPMNNSGGGGSSNANQPPPMSGGSSGMKPMGGQEPPPMPMGGGRSGSQRPRPERAPREQQPMPMGSTGMKEPMGGTGTKDPMGGMGMKEPMGGMGMKDPMGGTNPNGGSQSQSALPLEDPLTKQVWGHLPEKLRQQANQFYREQYLPRYSEMMKEYYKSLAEREKSPKKP
jgi:hypothetical protein